MRERDVLDYLHRRPGFFRRHRVELARKLRLAERDVVDLTGSQIISLRDENNLLRRQLRAWYDNAANNEQIAGFLHDLATELIKSGGKSGTAARKLRQIMKAKLECELCILCEIDGKKVKLADRDRARLVESGGALRTSAPLPSFAAVTGKADWKAYLYVPIWLRNSIKVVIVCATEDARRFPRDAHSDYAVQMAELVGAALMKEKQK